MIRSKNELAQSNRALVAEMMQTIAQIAEVIKQGNEQIAMNAKNDKREYPACESPKETAAK